MFLFLHMCVQDKGSEPFHWTGCINTAAIILSHFKVGFYSVAPLCSFPCIFICKITARAIQRAAWKWAGQEPPARYLPCFGKARFPPLLCQGFFSPRLVPSSHGRQLWQHSALMPSFSTYVPPLQAALVLPSTNPPKVLGNSEQSPAFRGFWYAFSRDLLFN